MSLGYVNSPLSTTSKDPFIPALKWRVFTPIYDWFINFILPEKKCKTKLISQCNLKAGERILDFGCGSAKLTIMAKECEPGIHITGLDIDSEILKIGNKNLVSRAQEIQNNNQESQRSTPETQRRTQESQRTTQEIKNSNLISLLEIELVEYNGRKFPFKDDYFDTVIVCLVFHHLTDEYKRIALTEIYRTLKPGGCMQMADWGKNKSWLMRICYFLVQLVDGFTTTSVNARGELPKFFTNAGFIEVSETGFINTVMGSLCYYKSLKSN